MEEVLNYINLEKQLSSNIMVIGVGGGGGNAVRYMYDLGIHNVMFMICNTDGQALKKSPIPLKIQLGKDLTQGLGAGNKPERGRDAAFESKESIKESLIESGVKMVFITAGMGGGTGTGAAPVIAEIAQELDILTVAIVTIPFRMEGPKRINQAAAGIEEIKKHVDALLVIDNENICKMYGDLEFSQAFSKADDILAIAAKGIAETITKEYKINVDFADVHTTMSNSGIALLGYSTTTIGDCGDIAKVLTENALQSPLLNQNNIYGAENILINISWQNTELKMSELHDIISIIQDAAGQSANIIWGAGKDETLSQNAVSIIIIATGFGNLASIDLGANIKASNFHLLEEVNVMEKEVFSLEENKQEEIVINNEDITMSVKNMDDASTNSDSNKNIDSNAPTYFSIDDDLDKVDKGTQKDDEDMVVSVAASVSTTHTDERLLITSTPLSYKKMPKNNSITDIEDVPAYLRRQLLKQSVSEINNNNDTENIVFDGEE